MSYIVKTGNLAEAPELRTAESGRTYARARVIVTDRVRTEAGEYVDGASIGYNLTVFGADAERLAEAVHRSRESGHSGNLRLLFAGRHQVREYQRAEGGTGISHGVAVDEVAVSLFGQTVTVGRSSARA